MEIIIWVAIIFCLSQSAVFSGLNLAFFSLPRLRLEIEVKNGNPLAFNVLRMRKDSNLLLTTILWGNVGINVLLTLLTNSIMTGVLAFLFSTIAITIFGEIMPQAYFSRHALKIASALTPVIRFYQIVLYPVVKPTALLLDAWLGVERINYYKEIGLKNLIMKHIYSESDIDLVEGLGAINFLSLDDVTVGKEGGLVNPDSILALPFTDEKPVFPDFAPNVEDEFLIQINKSQEKWVVITDKENNPISVLDADGFLRSSLFDADLPNPLDYSHKPIIVNNINTPLGEVIQLLKVESIASEDIIIDKDIILIWGKEKRIITGADLLGHLLKGIIS